MKKTFFRRLLTLLTALCLCALPTLSVADTYLPDGDVTHADFTLGVQLHADGFPAGKAHLNDWETFLKKLDLKGSADSLAMFTPTSRVYVNAALRLDGKDQVPFVYDGYHSYRYLLSPALGGEVLFFQMHNFLEFMLKPYYYMELPTQYLGLLMYPEATYYIANSYYAPLAEMIEAARQAALNGTPAASAGDTEALSADAEAADSATAESGDSEIETTDTEIEATGGDSEIEAADLTADASATSSAPAPTVSADGAVTYTVPYETLYEQCVNLDQIVNDDVDLERAYVYFTSLLTDIGISDMTLNMLGSLESVLDQLDPDQQGMTVTQTPDGMTCAFGETVVFARQANGAATQLTFSLPTPDGYQINLVYNWTPDDVSATLDASVTVLEDNATYLQASVKGVGLPREGDLGGKGNITFMLSGTAFDQQPVPLTFAFDWARDAKTLPYTLGLTVDWIHPQTGKPALTLQFNGNLSAADKNVFVEGSYPQNDFFNLNETFLEGYKERLLPSLALKFAPILLETPAGVINDLYSFLDQNNILVSFVE